MSIREIVGSDACHRCDKSINWKAEVFDGNPAGQMTGWTSGKQSAEIVFIEKNKVELTVTCRHCNNRNKFIKEV
ncbi:hypothetical protein D3C74_329070 [compost metagenome]